MCVMDPKYYAENSEGSECPNCRTENITQSTRDHTVVCNDCGATWTDTFKTLDDDDDRLTGYHSLVIPEGKET